MRDQLTRAPKQIVIKIQDSAQMNVFNIETLSLQSILIKITEIHIHMFHLVHQVRGFDTNPSYFLENL